MYGLYGALLGLAWVAVLPFQFVLPLFTGGPRPRIRERFGLAGGSGLSRPGGLWIHAVSVGEVRLGLSLASHLRKRHPGLPIHLTTTTATGRALAESARNSAAGDHADSVSELPLDFTGTMGRLLDRLRPRAILIMETEIWPNLLRLGSRRGIPIVLVNGRISSRSYPRYRTFRRFIRQALQGVRVFGMQTEEDAERIRDLGAPAERVRVTGNLKFDLPVSEANGIEVRHRLGLPPDVPVFVAGSTAPGEEAAVLQAFSRVRHHAGEARLVLAPRHPRDLARAGTSLATAGLRVATWSHITSRDPPPTAPMAYDALLVDVMGVLPEIYAAADLVFVGGSLVPRGGHNILEPAALGKPVLFGPHMENFSAAARALTEAGAGFVAQDGEGLGNLAVRLLSDRTEYAVASASARRVVHANRGAMLETLRLIDGVLAPAGQEVPSGSRVSRLS